MGDSRLRLHRGGSRPSVCLFGAKELGWDDLEHDAGLWPSANWNASSSTAPACFRGASASWLKRCPRSWRSPMPIPRPATLQRKARPDHQEGVKRIARSGSATSRWRPSCWRASPAPAGGPLRGERGNQCPDTGAAGRPERFVFRQTLSLGRGLAPVSPFRVTLVDPHLLPTQSP